MFFFDISLIWLVIYIVIISYLILFLPIFRGIHNWEEVYPNIIPIMSVIAVIMFVSWFFALFPVWGFLTIVIIVVIFMGFSMSLTFLPGGYIGTLLAIILMVAMSATSHYIPHPGLWHYDPVSPRIEGL